MTPERMYGWAAQAELDDRLDRVEADYIERTVTEWCKAAKARSVVRLTDGRTGRLVYYPGDRGPRSHGGKAVIMIGGAHYNIPPDLLYAVETP